MGFDALVVGVLSGVAGAVAGYITAARTRREAATLSDASEREAFERGRAAGFEEERTLLEVRVTPYQSSESEWFGMKKVLSVGYSHQIHYRNLPIGDPQRVITHVESTWDDEKVEKVLALAAEAAKLYVVALTRGGVRARLSK